MYRDFEPDPHLDILLLLVYCLDQGVQDTLATVILSFCALAQILLRNAPQIVLTAPKISQPKSNSLHFLRMKFDELNVSHIAKSTQSHSLPHLRDFAPGRPGCTIANWRNPGLLSPLDLVPESALVSYLGSPDLTVAYEAPGRTTPGCSQTTVRSPGMHIDSAAGALNAPARLLSGFSSRTAARLGYRLDS